MKKSRPKWVDETIRILRWKDGHSFTMQMNGRIPLAPVPQDTAVRAIHRWVGFWTTSLVWQNRSYDKGSKMIRVLIKKEPPFELHIVVNPTDSLDVAKIEEGGYFHIGEFDGEKQIDEAVAAVAVFLELEEANTR